MSWQGAQPGPSAYDHTNFSPTPSVGLPAGSTLFFEIEYTLGATPSQFVDTAITYSNENDLEVQLKLFFENTMGGVWTITATTVSGDIVIADITAIAAPDRRMDLLIVSDVTFSGPVGNESDHTWTKTAYIDPWVAAAIAFQDSHVFNTTDFSTCVWYGEVPLPTGSGTGTLEYTFQIQPSQITLDIEILDNLDQQVGSIHYDYLLPPLDPGGYQCDRYYALSQRSPGPGVPSATSRLTPTSFPFGPAPVAVIDWSGAVIGHMNPGAGNPLDPGSFCAKPVSSLSGTETNPQAPGNVTVMARTTTTNLGETVGAETLTVIGFSLSRVITMPIPGDRLDMSDWEGESVQIQYSAFDTCVGGQSSDVVSINVTVPNYVNKITVNPAWPVSATNFHLLPHGIGATANGGLLEVYAGTYTAHSGVAPNRTNRIRWNLLAATIRFVEPVIVDGNKSQAGNSNGVFLLNGSVNSLFDGMNNLTIINGNHDSLSTGTLTSGTTVKNVDIHSCYLYGVELVSCTDTVFVNVTVHDMILVNNQNQGFLLIDGGSGGVLNATLVECESYNNKDGFVVQNHTHRTPTFIDCIARDNSRQGVLCEQGGLDFSWIGGEVYGNANAGIQIENNSNNFVVRGAHVHHNNTYDGGFGGCGETGVWCDDSTDGVIEDCDIHDNGSGIRIDGDGTNAATVQDKSERIIVRRNKVYHNQGGDIACGSVYGMGFRGTDHVYVYNNTFWENGRTIGVGQSGSLGAELGGLEVLPQANGGGQTNVNLAFRNNINGKTVFHNSNSRHVSIELGSEFIDLDNNIYFAPPAANTYEVGGVLRNFDNPAGGYQALMAPQEAASQETDPLLNDSTLIPGSGSVVLGASSMLTTITGKSGTALLLTHPRYFRTGDVIEFENGDRAVIQNVTNNWVELISIPVTALIGQGVTLAGLVNIGAVQS